MIAHNVWIRFKTSVDRAERKDLFNAIAVLKDKISSIREVRFGANVSPEGLHGGFMDGITLVFETVEGRDAYLAHPDHVAAAEKLVAAAEGGLAGLLVFDMEIEDGQRGITT